MSANFQDISTFIWAIADLLRGPYRPPQYERVMLPMTVLRRFDCVLAPSKTKVLAEHDRWSEKLRDEALDAKLNLAAGQRYTVKRYESEKVKDADSWRHGRITLKPVNPDFKPILFTGAEEGEVQVIAELVEVLRSEALQ